MVINKQLVQATVHKALHAEIEEETAKHSKNLVPLSPCSDDPSYLSND